MSGNSSQNNFPIYRQNENSISNRMTATHHPNLYTTRNPDQYRNNLQYTVQPSMIKQNSPYSNRF